MNGGPSQNARVLIDASRSAKAHAERHLASKPQAERDELERQAFDTNYVHVHDFTMRWKAGEVK